MASGGVDLALKLKYLETLKWSVSQPSTHEHLRLYKFDWTTQNLNTQGTFVCLSVNCIFASECVCNSFNTAVHSIC